MSRMERMSFTFDNIGADMHTAVGKAFVYVGMCDAVKGLPVISKCRCMCCKVSCFISVSA